MTLYSHHLIPGIHYLSYFIIFNLTEKIVIVKHIISIITRRSSINWISMWFKLILLLFATVWTLGSRSLFWYHGGYPNNNFSHLCLNKTKKANNVHIFLDTKPYLAHDTKYFFLTLLISYLLEISLAWCIFGVHIPHGIPQLIYFEFHLVDTKINDLVYYWERNMLKIQHNKNYLQHYIFQH